jgi:hypothetical protein
VAFILFNRPDKTQQSFERIVAARPSKLFLIADGPRPNHPTDAANCAAARAVVEKVIEEVAWPCEIFRNYAEENLGLKRRVSSGLDWVFQHVEEAIILEDDILVDPSFFRFAAEMLERYRHDHRVMQIAGFNPIAPLPDYPYSYFFGEWSLIWGWATWRRAWELFDVTMSTWSPEVRQRLAGLSFVDEKILKLFDQVYEGKLDSWGYIWLLTNLTQSGLTVIPRKNLIDNIGFGTDATHTKSERPQYFTNALNTLEYPLVHPPHMMVDAIYQKQILDLIQPKSSRIGKAKRRLRKLLQQMGIVK